MELSAFFKSVIDQDRCAIVICDTAHTVVYMNPAAVERYAKSGGAGLVGSSLLDCHTVSSRTLIENVVEWFAADSGNNFIYTFHNEAENKDVYMVALRDENGALIGYYEKHEYRDPETGKLYDLYD